MLPLWDDASCPDVAMQFMDGHTAFMPIVAAGVAWSAEQTVWAGVLLARVGEMGARSSFGPYRPGLLLVWLWAFFTAASVTLVGVTWRSDAAVLAKTLHVATEAAFLWQILARRGFHVASSLVAATVFYALAFAVTMPCEVSLVLATTAGFVLDSANFVAHLLIGSPRLVLYAFACHALYLGLYFSLFMLGLGDEVGGSLRSAGMLFNLVAVEFAMEHVRREAYPPAVYGSRWVTSDADGPYPVFNHPLSTSCTVSRGGVYFGPTRVGDAVPTPAWVPVLTQRVAVLLAALAGVGVLVLV